MSNTLEMATEGPGKVDCSLVKYLILSPLMKGDVTLDERFTQGEEDNGGGGRGEREGPAGSLSPCHPYTGACLSCCYSPLEMRDAAPLSPPCLFLAASLPFLPPLSLCRRLSPRGTPLPLGTCPPSCHRLTAVTAGPVGLPRSPLVALTEGERWMSADPLARRLLGSRA